MTVEIRKSNTMRYLAIALGLAVLQTAVLGWMIESRAGILRSGEEILLKTAPVDPRDLLRGDYVILSYDVSTIPAALITGDRPDGPGWQVMQVRLKPGVDGFSTVAEASFGALARQEGSVVLADATLLLLRRRRCGGQPQGRLRHRAVLRAGGRGARDRDGPQCRRGHRRGARGPGLGAARSASCAWMARRCTRNRCTSRDGRPAPPGRRRG